MIEASEVQCFSFIADECFLTLRATRLDFSLVLGHCRLGVISVEAGRRKAWEIPACDNFNLELNRGRAFPLCTEPPTAHFMLLGATLSLLIQLPGEITCQHGITQQHMVPDEIRKREWELHGKSLLCLLLLSSEVLGHLEISHHPQVGEKASWHATADTAELPWIVPSN